MSNKGFEEKNIVKSDPKKQKDKIVFQSQAYKDFQATLLQFSEKDLTKLCRSYAKFGDEMEIFELENKTTFPYQLLAEIKAATKCRFVEDEENIPHIETTTIIDIRAKNGSRKLLSTKVYMAEVAIVGLIVLLIGGIIFDILRHKKEEQKPFDNPEDAFTFLQEVTLTQSDKDQLTQKEADLILHIQEFEDLDLTDFINEIEDIDLSIEDDEEIEDEILALANKIKIAQRTFIQKIFSLCNRYKLAIINTFILLVPYIALNLTLYFTRLQDPLFVQQNRPSAENEEKVKSRIKNANDEEDLSVYMYKNKSGSELCGYLQKSRDRTNKKVVLLFKPGGLSDIPNASSSSGVESYLLDEGYDIFEPSYRGQLLNRQSTNRYQDMYEDADAAYNFLVSQLKYREDQIVIMGVSMVTSCATYVAAKHKPMALVLDGAYTKILDVLPWYTKILFYPSLRYGFNTLQYIQKVTCPILLAHSKIDNTVPYSLGRVLFQTAQKNNNQVRFYEHEGNHNGFLIGSSEKHFYKVIEFLDQPGQFQSEGPKDDRRDAPNIFSLEMIFCNMLDKKRRF
ncbi:MAG: prolyl oligopeptidase family serine peptidase [Bacteroidota bacterium]